MSKAFDIQPKKKQEKKKIKKSFIPPSLLYTLTTILLILLIAGFIGYWANSRKTQIITTDASIESQETNDELGDKLISEQINEIPEEPAEPLGINEELFGPSNETSEKPAGEKTSLKIKFFNGSPDSDQATQIFNKLKDLGYPLTAIEKTKNRYFSSIIYYKSDKQAEAENLKKEVNQENIDIKQSTIVGEDDLWIVIGNK